MTERAVGSDHLFSGAIPDLYERYLVPLLFEPFADDLVTRCVARRPSRVLEVAAGTGVVTRRLARDLSADATIVATDLNPPMLEKAASVRTARPVEWRPADAQNLPFPDASFDLVVCQFGFMFFPDKPRAFSEARRVLRPFGTLLFNVWDRIDRNELADTVTRALGEFYPDDPPRFLTRVPYGYNEPFAITRDLVLGGFEQAREMKTLTARSRAASPEIPAVAFCQGTPLRGEIEERGAARLGEATGRATAAIAHRFGAGAIDAKMQAHVLAVVR